VITTEYALTLRYLGQDHALAILFNDDDLTNSDGFSRLLRERFEAEYLRRYGHLDVNAEIEVVEVDVAAERELPQVEIDYSEGASVGDDASILSHYGLDEHEITSKVVARGNLKPGDALVGPLIVVEEGATTVVPPGAFGEVLADRTISLEVADVAV
jgi:N-methylhydantoinase A